MPFAPGAPTGHNRKGRFLRSDRIASKGNFLMHSYEVFPLGSDLKVR